MLVVVGLVVAAVGALIWLGVPLGRLPGDFVIGAASFTFYFPLTTSHSRERRADACW